MAIFYYALSDNFPYTLYFGDSSVLTDYPELSGNSFNNYIQNNLKHNERPGESYNSYINIVEFKTEISPQITASGFHDCQILEKINNIENLNMSNVQDTSYMFENCTNLLELNITGNLQNIQSTVGVFYNCRQLQKIRCNNTGTAIDSHDMFTGCVSLSGGYGTTYDPSVVDISYARPADFGQPGYFTILAWQKGAIFNTNTLKFTDFYADIYNGYTINGSTYYTNIENIEAQDSTEIPGYSEMYDIFTVIFDTEISPISTARGFQGGNRLKELINLNNLNTSNTIDMSYMFAGCYDNLFNPDVSSGDTSNVTNMHSMFYNCRGTNFDPNFLNGNVSNVRDMRQMFYNCNQFLELNLKNGNTSNATYMTDMFTNCTSLKKLVLGQNGKFRPGCGLSDPIEQEIPNQNGSKYSGKGIRTKDINDKLDSSSRGLSANELMSQYTGSTSMTGTYEGEILHPTYIKTKNVILNTYGNSDNHLAAAIELPTSIPVELKECHSLQIAENSFNTYYYPITQTQGIVDGQYPIEYISTDYTIARKAVTIEIDFNKGQFPHYPAAPDPLPQTVPEKAIFKGGTTDFEHLYTNNDVGELENLTLYAVYFVYKKILEQKTRNPLDLSEGLTVDIFYQDDKGNVISQKELNKDENSLHLDYNILLQKDMATLDKVVQIDFPLDDFAITVGEPSTAGTASNTQQQGNFGDNINNINYLVSDENNKIKKAQIRKAQLPTPTFPAPIAVSNTEPSDALIGIETN